MRRLLISVLLGSVLGPVSALGAQECVIGVVPALDDRCETWSALYDHPGGYARGGKDITFEVAAGGGRVFVTGRSEDDANGGYDAYTIAYDATTGQQRWAHRYHSDGADSGNALAVSPDGTRVFVTGYRASSELLLIAYDAATGAIVWDRPYRDENDVSDTGIEIKATNDRVYALAIASQGDTLRDFLTVALDAATGDPVWTARFDGGGRDDAVGIEVSPDGSRVYAAGISQGAGSDDFAAVAYDAGLPEPDGTIPDTAGDELWRGGYDGPAGGRDLVVDTALRPDGSLLYLAGSSIKVPGSLGTIQDDSFLTAAFDTRDGQKRWTQRFDGPQPGSEGANGVAVSPDGRRVFVAGAVTGLATHLDQDYGTVAYDAASGEQLWTARYQLPGFIYEHALAVAATDARVYVYGFSGDGVYKGEFTTVAYAANTGAQAWAGRHNTTAVDRPFPRTITTSPDGSMVYATGYLRNNVAGLSCTNCNEYDYVTVAYQA